MADTLRPAPCTLVIFGGSGDLARRKLIPAVYNLLLDGALPSDYAVVGSGRKPFTDEEFRHTANAGLTAHSRQALQDAAWERFQTRLFYIAGAIDDPQAYVELRKRLEQIEHDLRLPGHRIFYLAIPPTSIAGAVAGLKRAGLVTSPGGEQPFSRIIVEKPIGRDLESAGRINAAVAEVFDESQVFRIDHYLGKETVQNLLVLRFANSIFEPLWNYKYIDHVQITVAEAEGVGTRATYYEEAGALRDMVQNHILQLLCLVLMEPPHSLDADVVRNAKMNVLSCLRPVAKSEVERHTVRAQYSAGEANGKGVPGYRQERGVRPDSTIETYVAMKLFVDNWRWSGVPFYVRTGKALAKRVSQIAIVFKPTPEILFNMRGGPPLTPNVLRLQIQPEEGFSLGVTCKVPGTKTRTHPVNMQFQYGQAFRSPSPEAYERLLLDVMAGDASLFMRRDAVEASWAWVSSILDEWQASKHRQLSEYPAGSWGPVEADRLIGMDGRAWQSL